jgi:hypothetical protein
LRIHRKTENTSQSQRREHQFFNLLFGHSFSAPTRLAASVDVAFKTKQSNGKGKKKKKKGGKRDFRHIGHYAKLLLEESQPELYRPLDF